MALPVDSAIYKAYFECDSTNRVLMRQVSEHKTANIGSNMTFENGLLTYKVKTQRDTIYIKQTQWITVRDKPIVVDKPIYTNQFYWWQTVLMWMGVALMLIIVLVVVNYLKQSHGKN